MDEGEGENFHFMKEEMMNVNNAQEFIDLHQKLETDFAKLQVTTQIDEYGQLLGKFREIEEDNFKKFNYVNELSQKIKG